MKSPRWMSIYSLCLSVTVVFLWGCDEVSSNSVALPTSVSLDCQISDCNNTYVVQNSALVYVSDSGCDNDFDVLASTTADISCSVNGCSGEATGSWLSETGATVLEVSEGLHDLCVHIDVDNLGGPLESTDGDILYSAKQLFDGSATMEATGSDWSTVTGGTP